MESLKTRVLTSIIGAIVVGTVLWVGLPLLLPTMVITAVLALREYIRMLERQDLDVRRKSLYAAGVAVVVAASPTWAPMPWPEISWQEVALIFAFGAFLVQEVISPGERPLERIVYSTFGLLYIPFLLGYFLKLRYLPDAESGLIYLLLPLIASVGTDIGGFFFGYYFGKRKLAPEVSPGKTVEGAIGGLMLSFVAVFVVSRLVDLWTTGPAVFNALLFSLLVSSAAQLGDLTESLIKRSLRAKDSGNTFPGHGGLLDRLDSLLFAVPITYLFLSVVGIF